MEIAKEHSPPNTSNTMLLIQPPHSYFDHHHHHEVGSSCNSEKSSPSSTNSDGLGRGPAIIGQDSVINFKAAAAGFGSFGGSLLSFDQNENRFISQNCFPRMMINNNNNNQQDDYSIWEDNLQYNALLGQWLSPSEEQNTTMNNSSSIQDLGRQETFSSKRPYLGENSPQAMKKQCTSAITKMTKSKSKDPQSIAAKNRRERISERLKILQDLVPNGSKVDLVTMLEKAISYVKFLQLQVKVLATDEFWPAQGGKAPDLSQVREAIDAILASQRDRNSSSTSN
ncbi:hypothetical protein M9H77_05594 [Catharanthus roseus]|uniref:Uncharacterized protein n=1 Tax=Catharanthus roseus TaxID=4058 RepID=A0ACC0CHC0_CATRO|nr:hypothetical protein M9H77_05594 [Catharanthus roseus]